jgi:hypothetical protein
MSDQLGGSINSEYTHTPGRDQELRGCPLIWRRDGAGWSLLAGRRRFGRLIPDNKYSGLWRLRLSGGRLGDMAPLGRAKAAIFAAAERELEGGLARELTLDAFSTKPGRNAQSLSRIRDREFHDLSPAEIRQRRGS